MHEKKRKFDKIDDKSISSHNTNCSVKKHKLLVRNTNGSLRELKTEDVIWYVINMLNPPHNNWMKNLFRKSFRMPYETFLEFAEEWSGHENFSGWRCHDAVGLSPSNIELLLFGSLYFLGRSWTFDDIFKSNGISHEGNSVFFSHFNEYGSSVF